MGQKIGKGLVKKQGATRGSSNYIAVEKVLDITKHDGEWEKFKESGKNDSHKINHIPYKITSEKDVAYLTKGDLHKEIGEYVYSFNYFCHTRVHDERDIFCLKRHFGQECCICDDAQKKWDNYNAGGKTDELMKIATKITAKMRSMYNIERLTDKKRGKNSFMESSDYIHEDEMIKVAIDCEDGQEPVSFYEIDAEEGKIVRFKRPKSAMKPSEGFKFLDRKKAISDKLLKGVLKFGEHIIIPTPQEVKDFYFGASFIEKDESDGDGDGEDDYVEPEETIDEEDETIDEETNEEEPESDETIDGEEDEGEGEEEGDRKEKGKPESCPSKKKFGNSYGKFDACDTCKSEMECFKENKRLKELKK